MKKCNKLLSILLCMVLLFGVAATPVFAEEQTEKSCSQVVVNPLYRDSITEEELALELKDLSQPTIQTYATAETPLLNSLKEVGTYVAGQMVNRETSITFQIPSNLKTSILGDNAFLDEAVKYSDSCSGQEGDALAFGYRGMGTRYTVAGEYTLVSCTMSYHSNSTQEQQLTEKVNQVMAELNLNGKTELEKVKAIYDYVCSHVSYDYSYQKYSAYNALVEGEAVCQGFAVLFYRLCKEANLSVRIIPGTAGGAHAWNIVRIGDVYYNADTTWDDNNTGSNYLWFLKSESDFAGHTREDGYVTRDFYLQFPMSKTSLNYDGTTAVYTKLNVANYEFHYTTIDGNSVATTAESKPKLLIYYNDSCTNSTSTIQSLTEGTLQDVDVIAIEVMKATKDEVKKVRDTYGNETISFTYDSTGNSVSQMWVYANKGGAGGSVSFPVLVYIDADNKLQFVSQGLSDKIAVIDRLEKYCGYSANKAKSIQLNTQTLQFKEGTGDTAVLTATISPANAINSRVVWSSSNNAVCTVTSEGLVTPKKEGTAVITANIGDESGITVYAACTVTVNKETSGNGGNQDTGGNTDNGGTGDNNQGNGDTGDNGENNSTPPQNGWYKENGAKYWYEDGVKQGTEGRGKEIYDPASDAWYWLDAPDGKMAAGKDVYQESLAGIWGDEIGPDGERYGKWVRYDENGHMVKGWQKTAAGTYYFDMVYGTMAKGYATVDGKEYYFNKDTGVLEREIGEVPEMGWKTIDGRDFWYEKFVRQGYSVNSGYRGKEIYDRESDAWFWLDNVDDGKKAVSKDVYQESLAGEWGDYVGEDGERYGKWVRYDENGHMIKGWKKTDNGTYYFDETYGTMAKGEAVIDGKNYFFDTTTGILK